MKRKGIATWAAFAVVGAGHAGLFLDDFSKDTSGNYIATKTYGEGLGGFSVSNGTLNIDGSGGTTYNVFHSKARLSVGETVRVVSMEGNPSDLYLTISTTTRGPNITGQHGIRLNWTSSGTFRARVYNNGSEVSRAFGDTVASGTEVALYISRVADTEYAVGYYTRASGSGKVTGISIAETAGQDIYIGVEKYASRSSFDQLEVLNLVTVPAINSFTIDPSSLREPRDITFEWATLNAQETTLNGEVVIGTSTVRRVSEPTFFTLVATGRNGFSVSQTLHVSPMVDPCFPSDRQDLQVGSVEKWTKWPRKRIQQLEMERDQLLAKISVLPQHDPIFFSTQLGYHSLFAEPDPEASLPPHQIDFKFRWTPMLDSIALAPAFHPKEPVAYAFPERFKIEVVDGKTGEFEEVVNWMEEDFPDPGPYPVFFGEIDRRVSQVRITIPQIARESGVAYYALGEVYLFRQKGNGRTGDNMAVWGESGIEIKESGTFSMPPQWDIQYLYDGIVGLGLPLSDEVAGPADLMITYDNEVQCSDKVQFTLDLGRVQNIGRIDFWPAAAPYLLALPSFGVPEKITVEMSANPDFKPVKVLSANNARRRMHRENLLSIIGEGYDAQYIRISMEGLGEYKGKRILGLGEISVSEYGEVLSANCKITAQGIPEKYLDYLPRLVDGYSWQRRILPPGEWVKGLAIRRPLDRRLNVVERELELARAEWQRIKQRSGIWTGVILVIGLVGGLVVQRQMRQRVMNKLKWRITRDLHDEVGSNLGCITLATRRMEDNGVTSSDISELSLMAREASASLKDVVWVADQTIIRLPDFLNQLIERAKRLFGNKIELDVELPSQCPDLEVPLPFKRHLLMFFKEAVHNCVRHSEASLVQISFSVTDKFLTLSLKDNGCGFDPENIHDGWGIDSMGKRAAELGGKMELRTEPGKGTKIGLKVPVSALQKKIDRLYKTSN